VPALGTTDLDLHPERAHASVIPRTR
jgi:hypothetical protein